MIPTLAITAALALAAGCGGPTTSSGNGGDGGSDGATGGGQIHAVDLIGAWVDAGAPDGEFQFTADDGNTYTGSFEADILPAFTTADYWQDGTQACTACHSAQTESSMHEMGLGSYDDIMAGADCLSGDCAAIVNPGDWDGSKLRGRLRNNRMPPGIDFLLDESNRDGPTVDGSGGGSLPAVALVGAWVDAGAENGEFEYTADDGNTYTGSFEADILPAFTEADYWQDGTQACTACHSAQTESSMHEMGLGSYDDIMAGADCLSGDCAAIVNPGDWDGSKLRERLRNNRMPPGIDFLLDESNRDGPVVTAGK